MLTSRRTLLLAVFLCIFLFSGSAYAVPIGNAWVAQHFDETGATGHYYLVIEGTNLEQVKLKGLIRGNYGKVASNADLDFRGLTGVAGNAGVTYFELSSERGILKNLNRRAKNISRRRVQNGKLAREDRRDWMADFVERKLAARVFRLSYVEGGQTYNGLVSYATFANPFEDAIAGEPTPDGGTSVPEPSMMLLLGTGLVGLAALRRRFK